MKCEFCIWFVMIFVRWTCLLLDVVLCLFLIWLKLRLIVLATQVYLLLTKELIAEECDAVARLVFEFQDCFSYYNFYHKRLLDSSALVNEFYGRNHIAIQSFSGISSVHNNSLWWTVHKVCHTKIVIFPSRKNGHH